MALATAIFAAVVLAGAGIKGDRLVMWILGPLFWLIGIAMALGAWHMGRRRVVLAVAAGRLLTLSVGPLGTRRREWAAADIADVTVGPSGVAINDRPVPELQVLGRDGTKQGYLFGRDPDELRWAATVLRRALGIGPDVPRG